MYKVTDLKAVKFSLTHENKFSAKNVFFTGLERSKHDPNKKVLRKSRSMYTKCSPIYR